MKLLILAIIMYPLFVGARSTEWTEEGRRIETKLIESWEIRLQENSNIYGESKIDFLSIGLIQLGNILSYDGHNSKADKIYDVLQNEFLSIPGHARYFADKIDMERAALKPGAYTESYDQQRLRHFKILAYLPSPETVKVLGDFLADDRDMAKAYLVGTPEEKHYTGGRVPNSREAGRALVNLGLRNPPCPQGFFESENIEKCRAWWEEVKSGKKAFSFKGQNVEYRFKPDGTWETIALVKPPADGPKPPSATQMVPEREEVRPQRSVETRETKETRTYSNVWAWGIGIFSVLLAGLVWLRGKKSSHG